VTEKFGIALRGFAELGRDFVLDGEIAVPDERGVTHLDDLHEAIDRRQPRAPHHHQLRR
jgi:hypothetical protein